ncbi:hypothetical protein PIB30_109281, partial [Stylosanthes scabra]|nr:hypothetical protein [Stylosanthes scabra]
MEGMEEAGGSGFNPANFVGGGGVGGDADAVDLGGHKASGGNVGEGNEVPIDLVDPSSSSDDSYESAEDEVYKPPSAWDVHIDSDSDSDEIPMRREKEVCKRRRLGNHHKGVSPKKTNHPKKANKDVSKGKKAEVGTEGTKKKKQAGVGGSSVGSEANIGVGPSRLRHRAGPSAPPITESDTDEGGGPD